MLIQDTRQLLPLSCNLSTACSSHIQQAASIKGIPWKAVLDYGRVIDETESFYHDGKKDDIYMYLSETKNTKEITIRANNSFL